MDFDELTETNEGGEAENIYNMLLEDNTLNEYKSLKDAVIFLIECYPSMLENSFQHVFEIAENFLKTKIITNENDLFSLIIYNTAIKKNNLNFEGINIMFSFTAPDAQLIKNLKIIAQNCQEKFNPKNKDFIQDNFPLYNTNENNININNNNNNISNANIESEITLNEALWICHSELKNLNQKDYNRRIFLFTDEDNPMSALHNKQKRELTIQRAKDMLESEIIIELFPMNFQKNFDLRKFYCEIIPKDESANQDFLYTRDNSQNKLRELTKRIRQKEIKKRTLGSCMFYVSKDVKVSVNFFSTVRKTIKNRAYMVDARTNKTLSTVNQVICNETGETLFPHQIGTFHEYGGKKIQFTKEDMKAVKTFDAPGIKLMGFKSLDKIKPFYNIRESYFIYPNENMTAGASQLFEALIKQMVNKSKVALVKFVPREGTNIRFCALLPQKEAFDEDYFQTPPGFNLIFLPYSDELRSNADIFNSLYGDKKKTANSNLNKDKNKKIINEDDAQEDQEDKNEAEDGENKKKENEIELSEEQKNLAKKLVKKMTINFDSRNFENPSIQKFYSTLQALALRETSIEPVEDQIQPDKEGLEKLNCLDAEFSEAFYGEVRKAVFNQPTKKGVPNRKRTEIEPDGDEEENGVLGSKAAKKSKKAFKNNEDLSSQVSSSVRNKSKNANGTKKKSDYSDDDLLQRLEDGSIASFTIAELKEICQTKSLRFTSKMKKNDFLELVRDYLTGVKENQADN